MSDRFTKLSRTLKEELPVPLVQPTGWVQEAEQNEEEEISVLSGN